MSPLFLFFVRIVSFPRVKITYAAQLAVADNTAQRTTVASLSLLDSPTD